MTAKRFRKSVISGDRIGCGSDSTADSVASIQPPATKLIKLDDSDPGYGTEHALLVTDGGVRLLSRAVEAYLIGALQEHDDQHSVSTAGEALARLVAAHNLRPAKQRTDGGSAVTWLEERLVGLSEQWNPSELALALNERERVRRENAQ